MIAIQAIPGDTVGDVAVMAIHVAARIGRAVGMRHNATTITVRPEDDVNDVLARFDDADRARRLELVERDNQARETTLNALYGCPATIASPAEVANAIRRVMGRSE